MPRLVLLALTVIICACATVDDAAEDRTRLSGQVPTGLGRVLEVRISGGAAPTTSDLFAAVQVEFEGRDLFERVELAGSDEGARARRASRLELAFEGEESREVVDTARIDRAWLVRFDLAATLRDPDGRAVLEGTVSGVAVDQVTELDELEPERKDDMRVAALHDAASKLSRALRRAADDRARAARESLEKVALPPGAGPVLIAVLGFDDEAKARRVRGPQLATRLDEALLGLGPDVTTAPRDEVERALEADSNPAAGVFALTPTRLSPIARRTPARLFIVGRVVAAGGKLTAEARVLDRAGAVLFTRQASADGLGALRVVAVELARQIGQGLVDLPPG